MAQSSFRYFAVSSQAAASSRAAHNAPVITPDFVSNVMQGAISSGKLSSLSPVGVFYNLDVLRYNAQSLIDAFPSDALHGFALKAAPFPKLVQKLVPLGIGAECASIVELACAQAARVPARNVIFDSPAKTDEHLRYALTRGYHINANSVDELGTIERLRDECNSSSTVGLRVNPQLGTATISETFTAAAACQFGEPLKEKREEIIAAFDRYAFLTCIHVHVGSQGCGIDVILGGVEAAVALADEVNDKFGNRVSSIDIGGGLSVNYSSDSASNFEKLASLLRDKCEGLFKYHIMSEFGRHMSAKTAFLAAQVTSVRQSGGKTFVICQVGADVFMRPVYQPGKWWHRIEVYEPDGKLKKGETAKVDVAGPLCFAGDILARDREVVVPEVGDYVVVRDVGAYTLSMHLRHTSQLAPPVYGVEADGSLMVIKRRESVEESVRFWGA
ncbi:Pyridoxal-dependent decarboxylase [Gracilaria domingensis]|nr:Pyridoxal-dependent decarboxylase [Gracilaria domingensis]